VNASAAAQKTCEVVGAISRALCWLAGLILLGVMGLATCVDVVIRTWGIWGAGIPGIWEMVTLAMRAMIGLALPYAFYSGSHIAVEFFTDALSPRLRQGAIVLALLCSTLVMTLLAWKVTDRLLDIRSYGGVTADLGLPSYVDWVPLALGPWLSIPVLLALLWREGTRLIAPAALAAGDGAAGNNEQGRPA